MEVSDFLYLFEPLELPKLGNFIFDGEISEETTIFVLSFHPIVVEVLCDLVKIVLSSLRQVNAGIMLLLPIRLHIITSPACLLLGNTFFFEPGWGGCLLEEELVSIVPLSHFLVECLRPLLVVIDVLSDLT